MVALAKIPELPAAELPPEHWSDRVLTQLGTAVDTAMVRAMGVVVNAALMPTPESLPAMRAAAARLLGGELQRTPRRLFDFLDGPAAPATVAGRFRRNVDGGVIIARELTGAYRPFDGNAAVPEPTVAGGGRVPVEHWMHEPEPARGTVVALHGFAMGQPRIDAAFLFATHWFRRGLDVAVMTLPFHGVRTPSGARFSGERFAASNPQELAEAVRQAVYEIRLVTDWLRGHTGAPVGLLGMSLGGYLTALMAGLSHELDFAIPIVPPVCIGDLAFRFFERSRLGGRGEAQAFSYDELRATYRVHSPLSFPLRVAKDRVLIIAGRGDRIVPPEHPHALWRHWGEPKIHWFSGSHLAPFRRQRIVAEVAGHLEGLGIL